MHKTSVTLWLGIVLGLLVGAPVQSQQRAMPPGHPVVDQTKSNARSAHSFGERSITGTVIETMDASSYTYVHVDAGSRSVWAAAPQFPVKVGDRVSIPTGSPMQNYRSDSLGRTFPLVYFAGKIRVAAAGTRAELATDRSAPHPSPSRVSRASALSFEGIVKPDGGRTIGEVFDGGKGLAGSEVAIRGRVVKYSPRIMGTNWIHLQDGTEGRDGDNDLVITTDDVASVGDLVLVRGVVRADRDFGYGYFYELIVEGAKVTAE
ncbi:MAG: hypothetical protein IH881_10470 [Myxococcales bacterium]|nr:hypothetical protein [Myxococcales bacterium]